jgi:hypothetical protein
VFYLGLFRALEREKVEYLVVGGLAVMFHDVERSAMNIGLVLAMREDNLRRLFAVANTLGLAPHIAGTACAAL